MRTTFIMTTHSVFAVALLIAGCNAHLEPVKRPAFTAGTSPIGIERMGTAVRSGIAAAGWKVLDEAPGKTDAVLKLSGEKAIVYITYSDIDYSINLKQVSEGLEYDGERVHKRYNYWVERLSKAIQAETRKPPAAADGPPKEEESPEASSPGASSDSPGEG
jgi:hypothetical protein